jgi:hypothetical protein
MKQYQQVIEVMENNNGFATLGYLNQNVNVANWKTKTPFATIRRIVQERNEIFRIKPGLWALESYKSKLPYNIYQYKSINKKKQEAFNHSYYQGLLVEIGNIKKLDTFVPYQDKNKMFLASKLSDIATVQKFYNFSYPELIRHAITIDVIWFNERKMPTDFFEIEHSTDIKNSLSKFVELQDLYSKFYIVANIVREQEFIDKLNMTSFKDIRERVKFLNYDNLSSIHSKTFELHNINKEYKL